MTTPRARRRLARTAALLVATAVAAGAALPTAEAKPPKGATARVSEGPKGEQLNGFSFALGLSEDGRSALFTSRAADLLPGPGTPDSDEVYVRDLRNGHIERVSVADDGSRLNAPTADASISGDGRYVAFTTTATNVVPGQSKRYSDVFVRDRWTGRTEPLVPGDDDGSSDSPVLSRDGRYALFALPLRVGGPGSNRFRMDLYARERTGRIERVSLTRDGAQSTADSLDASVDATGDTVLFSAADGNLVPGDTNAATDVFLRHP